MNNVAQASRLAVPQMSQPSRSRRVVCLLLATCAAVLLVASLKLPLWQMRMEAPQYRGEEALRISVHPDALRGDLQELKVLDQYIGVHVPGTLPQFKWLPQVIIAGAILGILAALLPVSIRSRALPGVSTALTLSLAIAAIQACSQMRHIGHDRDAHSPLVGVEDFTPPFLGTAKIAQFDVNSRFGLGAWLIGAALALQLGAAWSSRNHRTASASGRRLENPAPADVSRLASATTHGT